MLDKARQGGAALAVSLAPILVLALLIVSLFLLVCGYLASPIAFNSDNLLSSAQCDDLLHGRDVTDWHLPGAPYIFPDLLLLMPCHLLMPTLPTVFLAYCLALHLILAVCLVWLGRVSGLRWRPAVLAAGCGGILLVATYLHPSANDRGWLLVHPGSHVAALVVGLFLLALTIHLLQRGVSWPLAAVYVLVGGMASFSDRLLVAQLLAPLVLALLVLAAGRVIAVKAATAQIALLGMSFLLACLLNLLFARRGFHLLGLESSTGRLHLPDLFSLLRRLYQGIADESLLRVLILLHFLAALVVVCCWMRRSTQTPAALGLHRPALLLASLTFLLSPLCIVGALFVLRMSHLPAAGRYTLSCWFLPPLLLPLLTCWLPGRAARAAAVTLQASIVAFALQRASVLLPGIDYSRFKQPCPPLAQALDRLARERGPLYGLAGFWTARATNWWTRERVVVNALSTMGEPYFHASNPARFLPDDDLRLPKYQFLIVRPGEESGPSASVLTLQYGEPAEKIAVGNEEIWWYDTLRPPAFERFLRTRLAGQLHRRRPYTGPIEPACLAHPKANMTPPDAPGTVALEAGQGREIRFAQPITGQLLDVGANDEARLEVEFYHGAERLGRLPVPSVPWTGASYEKPGLQSRLVPLPAALQARPWDRLVVRPHPSSANVRLGHVLVFADRVAGLEEERPPRRIPRIRLEAEELLPRNPDALYRDEDDATASGGRARRGDGNFCCCINYTPRLFLPPGRYRLEFALKVDSNASADPVFSLVVGTVSPPAPPLADRCLRGRDFPAAGRWTIQIVTFEIPEDVENVQIGIVGSGRTPIGVDYIDVIAEPPGPTFSDTSPKRSDASAKCR